jgi:hypothetical protein
MEPTMATIIPFLQEGENVFRPKDITAMSMALDDVCKTLNLQNDSSAREVMAVRIIELAKAGEFSPTRLRDRVLREANMAARVGLDDRSAGIMARWSIDYGAKTSNTDAEGEQPIRERAYQLWQADGAPEGKADEYWHRARELIEEEAKSEPKG